jgi:hypothetical protein
MTCRTLVLAAAFAATASTASAQCVHNGVVYDLGAEICAGGSLQICTTSGAWAHTGWCRAPDPSTAGRVAPTSTGAAGPLAASTPAVEHAS